MYYVQCWAYHSSSSVQRQIASGDFPCALGVSLCPTLLLGEKGAPLASAARKERSHDERLPSVCGVKRVRSVRVPQCRTFFAVLDQNENLTKLSTRLAARLFVECPEETANRAAVTAETYTRVSYDSTW